MSDSAGLLQSSLDQWVALQKLAGAAKSVLPEAESEVLDETLTEGASRTLHRLEEYRTPTPTSRECGPSIQPGKLVELCRFLESQVSPSDD